MLQPMGYGMTRHVSETSQRNDNPGIVARQVLLPSVLPAGPAATNGKSIFAGVLGAVGFLVFSTDTYIALLAKAGFTSGSISTRRKASTPVVASNEHAGLLTGLNMSPGCVDAST